MRRVCGSFKYIIWIQYRVSFGFVVRIVDQCESDKHKRPSERFSICCDGDSSGWKSHKLRSGYKQPAIEFQRKQFRARPALQVRCDFNVESWEQLIAELRGFDIFEAVGGYGGGSNSECESKCECKCERLVQRSRKQEFKCSIYLGLCIWELSNIELYKFLKYNIVR